MGVYTNRIQLYFVQEYVPACWVALFFPLSFWTFEWLTYQSISSVLLVSLSNKAVTPHFHQCRYTPVLCLYDVKPPKGFCLFLSLSSGKEGRTQGPLPCPRPLSHGVGDANSCSVPSQAPEHATHLHKVCFMLSGLVNIGVCTVWLTRTYPRTESGQNLLWEKATYQWESEVRWILALLSDQMALMIAW